MPNELLEYVRVTNPADLVRDLLDVFITYYIFYRVALVLKGTRGIQVVVGLVLVFILYVVAELLRLRTVLTLLTAVLSSAILVGVVVFQNDIRRGLMRVGARARFGSAHSPHRQVIDDVTEAATTLARHRTGAIITFEQDANLDEFVGTHTGHEVDAAVSPELLVTIFLPEAMNKLHDGAVVIRDLRIAKAGVFFPMPEGRVADESFGSRHRAAIGITEETDAIVIVVSEERGSISFCFNGNIISNLDGPKLRAALDGVFAPRMQRRRWRWPFGIAEEPAQAPAPAPEPAPQPAVVTSSTLPEIEVPVPELRTSAALRRRAQEGDESKPSVFPVEAPPAPAPKPLRKSVERPSERPPPLRASVQKTTEFAENEGSSPTLMTPLGHLAPAPPPPRTPSGESSTSSSAARRGRPPESPRPMPRAEADEPSPITPVPALRSGDPAS